MGRRGWTALIVFVGVLVAGELAWAGEAEPWLGRLLGRGHPVAVHFPISLLLVGAMLEAINLIRRRPIAGDTALVFVCLGAATAILAAALGWQAGSYSDLSGRAAEMLETHRWLGVGTVLSSALAVALCFAIRSNPATGLQRAYLTMLLGCGITVGVGGHYGGMLVFGDDHFTSAIPYFRVDPASLASVELDGPVDFERDVVPIFESSCNSCHGPDKQKGELRLDARHLAIHGAKSGKAVIPGDGENSTVVRRLLGLDNEKRMPQNEDPLSTHQIATIKAWIDQGAQWPETATIADARISIHWAYVPPERGDLPDVDSEQWVRNPIDRYVLAALEAEGLEPSEEADRTTLLRRISFDLTGLPPTPREVDSFVNDSSPDAYDVVVDRLLESDHYGERWAVPWLDAARYADSNGYQRDETRSSWPYRDWVIRALNRDMPFDQFTVEQIAGDLLPSPTIEQLVATGFHRGAPINLEGGADPEEYRVAQVFDRTTVTGTVWLGTTFECAQCHEHPYDPLSHREYYELFGYFNNTEIETAYGVNGVEVNLLGPYLDVPSRGNPDAKTLVMTERATVRPTRVLERGSFLSPGEEVEPGTPAFLHTNPVDAPANRLGLAQWLISAENPLTARVTVNRFWAEIFGRGLVETVEDFGANGATPSHPELLDWLALEFIERGWSMKRLHRLIVQSATYRQASNISPRMLERDPQNVLLSRGPRVRLTAEMIRDNALSISGNLNGALYGPPVFPEQPAGLWKDIAGLFSVNPVYPESTGSDRYRRSIYTVWRRTALYPSFTNFDAPGRSSTCVRRQRSNTPLQALTLLNDPVYSDLAKKLAQRIMKLPKPATVSQRIVFGFRLAVARQPNSRELDLLEELYEQELTRNVVDPTAAKLLTSSQGIPKWVSAAEWAAWYYVSSTLLNLDETITKG